MVYVYPIILFTAVHRFLYLSARCVAAVKKEWKSADDCVKFWLTDYNDDTLTKLALMQRMGMCLKCSPPKERITLM